jgi:hypothetical protein
VAVLTAEALETKNPVGGRAQYAHGCDPCAARCTQASRSSVLL